MGKYLVSLTALAAFLGLLWVVPSFAETPSPLLAEGVPVSWWFVFKLNASFPGCSGDGGRVCLFGGDVKDYKKWGQQFLYASSASPVLQRGEGCSGDSIKDPLGATFQQIYDGPLYYVVWNDQFYDDPQIEGCSKSCGAPWGHSKGVVAWDEEGNGVLIQVTTPSWPASGNKAYPRQDGNTLGCVTDNNVLVSQHFFALKLAKDDLIAVLQALANSSVVTNPADPQLVRNGGPSAVQSLVASLGQKSPSNDVLQFTLSNGVRLVSKPSALHVPPWQMLSSVLGGVSLRAASWWANPKIYSTTAETAIACWSPQLGTKPGAVEIATSGIWDGVGFGLEGGLGANKNHAKIGVSTDPESKLAVFGDLNQQGDALTSDEKQCGRSQNGRGGLFWVLEDQALHDSLAALLKGDSAPPDPASP